MLFFVLLFLVNAFICYVLKCSFDIIWFRKFVRMRLSYCCMSNLYKKLKIKKKNNMRIQNSVFQTLRLMRRALNHESSMNDRAIT